MMINICADALIFVFIPPPRIFLWQQLRKRRCSRYGNLPPTRATAASRLMMARCAACAISHFHSLFISSTWAKRQQHFISCRWFPGFTEIYASIFRFLAMSLPWLEYDGAHCTAEAATARHNGHSLGLSDDWKWLHCHHISTVRMVTAGRFASIIASPGSSLFHYRLLHSSWVSIESTPLHSIYLSSLVGPSPHYAEKPPRFHLHLFHAGQNLIVFLRYFIDALSDALIFLIRG